MADTVVELRDWRSDATVVAAQRERDAAAATVGEMEAEHRKLVATASSAEREVEEVTARLHRGEVSLAELSRSKSALSAARAAVATVEKESENAYLTLSTAEGGYKAACEAAQRVAWPTYLRAYRGSARRLMDALSAAMEAEEEVVRLHARMSEAFGEVGGWIVPPDDTPRVAYAGFGRTRRLTRVSFSSWSTWVRENVLAEVDSGKLRERAKAAADSLRAMVAGV